MTIVERENLKSLIDTIEIYSESIGKNGRDTEKYLRHQRYIDDARLEIFEMFIKR